MQQNRDLVCTAGELSRSVSIASAIHAAGRGARLGLSANRTRAEPAPRTTASTANRRRQGTGTRPEISAGAAWAGRPTTKSLASDDRSCALCIALQTTTLEPTSRIARRVSVPLLRELGAQTAGCSVAVAEECVGVRSLRPFLEITLSALCPRCPVFGKRRRGPCRTAHSADKVESSCVSVSTDRRWTATLAS